MDIKNSVKTLYEHKIDSKSNLILLTTIKLKFETKLLDDSIKVNLLVKQKTNCY